MDEKPEPPAIYSGCEVRQGGTGNWFVKDTAVGLVVFSLHSVERLNRIARHVRWICLEEKVDLEKWTCRYLINNRYYMYSNDRHRP